MDPWKMFFVLNMGIFHCYVSLPDSKSCCFGEVLSTFYPHLDFWSSIWRFKHDSFLITCLALVFRHCEMHSLREAYVWMHSLHKKVVDLLVDGAVYQERSSIFKPCSYMFLCSRAEDVKSKRRWGSLAVSTLIELDVCCFCRHIYNNQCLPCCVRMVQNRLIRWNKILLNFYQHFQCVFYYVFQIDYKLLASVKS